MAEHSFHPPHYEKTDCCDRMSGRLGLYTLHKCQHTVVKLHLDEILQTNFSVDNFVLLANNVINIKIDL